ncbi:hypothetical protein [Sphingobacterium sp.]|uniref:hypothetical protein n=1 Tax=Sphingobacterium sp. TaxID=341027 RepID=UPI002FDCF457
MKPTLFRGLHCYVAPWALVSILLKLNGVQQIHLLDEIDPFVTDDTVMIYSNLVQPIHEYKNYA